MDPQSYIKDIAEKEIIQGLYDFRIENLSIYSRIRYNVRKELLKDFGASVFESREIIKKKAVIKSSLISFFQFFKLIVLRKKYTTVFFAFPRVDRIGDYYFDKFTDPLIDAVDFKNDFIIFDHGRGGVHPKPRINSDKIIYLDWLAVKSKLYTALFWKKYYKRHSVVFDSLQKNLQEAFGKVFSIRTLVKMFLTGHMYSKYLMYYLRLISAQRVLGPARAYMAAAFYAAKQLNIKSFELQHGITYGETQMYSGYRDPMLSPDLFLAFGNNNPLDVYGIEEKKIANIGWAMGDFVEKRLKTMTYKPSDVLVVSDPEITDKIIAAVMELAEANPKCDFYVRLHPHEKLNEQQTLLLKSKENIKLQDKSINISIVLHGFSNVIGEDSTVLYEALTLNKKVGKLFMHGLEPHYLKESDKSYFWEIHDSNDFIDFINGSISDRRNGMSIYSPFNKELFCELLEL